MGRVTDVGAGVAGGGGLLGEGVMGFCVGACWCGENLKGSAELCDVCLAMKAKQLGESGLLTLSAGGTDKGGYS